MELIINPTNRNTNSFCCLDSGTVFRMAERDDIRCFGANNLFMALDSGDFTSLTGERCGELFDPGQELSDGSNTVVEIVSNAAITLT